MKKRLLSTVLMTLVLMPVQRAAYAQEQARAQADVAAEPATGCVEMFGEISCPTIVGPSNPSRPIAAIAPGNKNGTASDETCIAPSRRDRELDPATVRFDGTSSHVTTFTYTEQTPQLICVKVTASPVKDTNAQVVGILRAKERQLAVPVQAVVPFVQSNAIDVFAPGKQNPSVVGVACVMPSSTTYKFIPGSQHFDGKRYHVTTIEWTEVSESSVCIRVEANPNRDTDAYVRGVFWVRQVAK